MIDKRLKLAVNPHLLNKNETGRTDLFVLGWENRELTLTELVETIRAGNAYTAQLKGSRRAANFLASDVLSVDIDRGMTIEQALAHPLVAGHAAFIYTTASHTDQAPRIRVGFIAPRTITDAKEMRAAGQRIFQQPFSWKSVGVDIRGRSRSLRVNYRTSHQIRMEADKLLGPVVTDVDGNSEIRTDTVSVFNGPLPTIRALATEVEENTSVGQWISDLSKAGLAPHEIGVFFRSEAQLERARAAVKHAGIPFKVLDEHVETTSGYASIGTMHLAKGLEFRAVAVMACDDEVIPLQQRIEMVGDDADLKEVYDTERHLLYVACTRARDHLLVTGVKPVSEFLDDFQ